ncbi:MAG: amidohydrolase [Chloroflexota bacterium]
MVARANLSADLIIENARIYTVDDSNPIAQNLAVRDGRIVAVGSDADVDPLSGPESRVVDLGGKTVIPGLIDSHVHLLEFALRLRRVELAGASTLEEALDRVRAAATLLKPGEWILGGGFDSNQWGRLPNRLDLDSATPSNPAFLASKDMHSGWANSIALKLAGIDAHTADPTGGEIVRDPDSGEPTGILRESAVGIVARCAGLSDDDSGSSASGFDPKTIDSALVAALDVAASKGLAGLHVSEGPQCFSAIQRLRASGALSLRIFCHIRRENLPDALRLGIGTGFGDEWLRIGYVKLFLDGALGSQTDHTLAPHLENNGCGIDTMPYEELREVVISALKGGIAPAIHAIGDAANRKALDVLEENLHLWKPANLRPRIEHVQLLHPEDVGRLGRLGIIASMQPIHQPSDWIIADRYWGPERTPLAYAWRAVLDSGAVLAFGSDCPVEPIDPLPGLFAAVTRQTRDFQPEGGWHPEQRLTPMQALRAYTLGSAYASSEERDKGSLSPGKLADFVVLSDDPFAGPPELFLRTEVLATVVGGRVVFGDL